MEKVWLVFLALIGLIGVQFSSVRCRGVRRRPKREWVVPTKLLRENYDYKNSSHIARIRSDHDEDEKLYYSLSGPGADERPYNLFMVAESTGLVFVKGTLDREERETYILTGTAWFQNGTVAERGIDLRFDVDDENDNPPIFPEDAPAMSVNESSPADTLVGPFTAKDKDKEGTLNAKISYRIVKQVPEDDKPLFYINNNTGEIYVKENMLDREREDSYTLTVMGVDMGGAANGRSGTGTIKIDIHDINDNIPTLEKDTYEAKIIENVAHVEVMRIKADDKDLAPTDNWLAVFDIVAGNEDGIFSIKTDPDTNEGILMLEKPVDFEVTPDIQLGVVVANAAPVMDMGPGLGLDAGLDMGLGLDMGGEGEGEGDGEGDGDGDGDGDGGGDGDGDGGGGGDGEGGGGADLGLGVDLGGPGLGLGAGASPAAGAGPAGGGGLGAPGPDLGPGLGLGAGAGAGLKPKKRRPKKKKKKPKGKVYAVNVAVQNEPEGASFIPTTKNIPVSEDPNDLPADGVIATYPAIDEDTGQPSEDVSYAKGYDPENLLTIDPETAEIKLTRAPDRESPFVVNGTYVAKIFALARDMPSQTATGTIALKVADVNDNCPTLQTTMEYVCTNTEIIPIAAHDPDGDPNGAPFTFKLVSESSRGDWELQDVDDTSANLVVLSPLWPGTYEVMIMIWDQQGLSCPEPQMLEVQACLCEEGQSCGLGGSMGLKASQNQSSVGLGGIGAALLALVALLIAAALLATCGFGKASGAFSEIPIFTEDHLMVYHTEGQGEDKDFPLLSSPVQMAPSAISRDLITAKSVQNTTRANMTSAFASHMSEYELGGRYNGLGSSGRIRNSSFGESGGSQVSLMGRLQIENMVDFALPDRFLHGYYAEKSSCVTVKDHARDSLLVYEFEGRGSRTGSLDCISGLDSDDDLSFLNNLELKFKALSEICAPPATSPLPSIRSPALMAKATPSSPPIVPPMASIAPTVSTMRDSSILSKTNLSSNFSTLSKISQQSVHDKSINSTFQRSKSLANLTQDAPTRSLHDQRLQSASIIQLPPLNPPCAAMPRSLGQAVVMQQQPIYYITSPIMQPTSPVFQPAMHYVVQPPIQNTMVFAEPQAANMQGVVLLQNGFGSMEQIAHPARAMSLGGRRYMSVIDIGQHLEAEQASGSVKSGRNLGKKGRRMSESQLKSGVSMSVHDIGQHVEAERVSGSQGGMMGRRLSEDCLYSEGYAQSAMANPGEGKAKRKSRRRIMSMAELSEQVDDEETAQIEEKRDAIYRSSMQFDRGNLTTLRY